MKKVSTENFIKRANQAHNNKYDYSNTVYVNAKTKVKIMCPEHGEFEQTPNAHLNGAGCPVCAKEKIRFSKQIGKEDFLKRAHEVHGDTYNYSKIDYIDYSSPIEIVCKKHGSFWQKPFVHLKGCGCQKCKNEKSGSTQRLTKEEFIDKANIVHNNKYDYSKVIYVNYKTPLTIICPEHGEFEQMPLNHLHGRGCPICGRQKSREKKVIDKEEVIKRANIIHSNKYDYSKLDYNNEKDKVCIICPEHGEFFQELNSHTRGVGCPKCSKSISLPETEIKQIIEEKLGNGSVEERNRTILKPYEIDLYVPSKNVGIEYNGLVWHSEKFKNDKNYHLRKLQMAAKAGVRLIQIFEDEFLNKKDIVIDKVLYVLGLSDNEKIFARNCDVRNIAFKDAKFFLDANHIQGSVRATVHLGCFYKNTLVAVMSLMRENKTSDKWELVRYASKLKTSCIGCGGKLFKYFVKKYQPKEVKSFADLRWVSENKNLYEKIGFKKDGVLKPDYRYYNSKFGQKRIHKFNFRKQNINKSYKIDTNKTESEITRELGFYKVWDCGLIRYKWYNNESAS